MYYHNWRFKQELYQRQIAGRREFVEEEAKEPDQSEVASIEASYEKLIELAAMMEKIKRCP